jgi:hypothetical protein
LANKELQNDIDSSKLFSLTIAYLKKYDVHSGTFHTKNHEVKEKGKIQFDTVPSHKEFMDLFNEAPRLKKQYYPRPRSSKLLATIIAIDEENIKSKKNIKQEKERKAKAGFIRF